MYKFAAGMLTALGILAGVVLLASCGADDDEATKFVKEWNRELEEKKAAAAKLPACTDIWVIGKVLDPKLTECRGADGFASSLGITKGVGCSHALWDDDGERWLWANSKDGWKVAVQPEEVWRDPRYAGCFQR